MPSQAQLRESITRQLIEALESGGLPPWRKPWSNDPAAGPACNVVSRKKYRGINPLLLACASMRHHLQSKFWGTFNQWREMGGRVMRRPSDVPPGEWGTGIIFWSKVTKVAENRDGEEEEKDIFFIRSYALGELMAEIGSCYLASELGIPTADISVNHQSYIASWLRGLQNDHRFIFQASSQASKAADFILSFSRQPVAEEEPAMT